MDFQYIAWGARGSEFESRRSDQTIKKAYSFYTVSLFRIHFISNTTQTSASSLTTLNVT